MSFQQEQPSNTMSSSSLSLPKKKSIVSSKDDVVVKNDTLNMTTLLAPMHVTHASTINQSYEWRIHNLRQLRKLHANHKREFQEALHSDLGKGDTEALWTEVLLTLDEIDFFLANLKNLMTPTKVASPAYNAVCFSQINHVPLLGPAVLVIGPFNYPAYLTLGVAAGALACGNPVVLKPSEQTPATSKLTAKLVQQYFDAGSMQVVQGGKEVVTDLLREKWGKIVFTGSERVGRIVAEAAAKTLTPVLLELGGKSPVYVDEAAPNLKLVAQRIVWGKTFNGGQTCVAPDYVVVHEKHKERLIQELVKAVTQQFGTEIQKRSNMTRIVQESHAERLFDLIQEVEGAAGCKVFGGSDLCDPEHKFIHPTIVVDPPMNSRLMKEEIFGPVLPIVTVGSRQEAQSFINHRMYGTPLAMYVFTSKESVYRDMLRACPAASSMRNDVIVHFGNSYLPAGGLGTSGNGGCTHGIYSWSAFTHPQSQAYRPCYPTSDFGGIRFHPFNKLKHSLIIGLSSLPAIPPYLRSWTTIGLLVYGALQIPVVRSGVANGLALAVEFLRK